jgi:mevalonate kinase
MRRQDFFVRIPGKWILAGEHSVLRGKPALAFPLKSRTLDLRFESKPGQALHLETGGECGEELRLLFWGVLERACDLARVSRSEIQGNIYLESHIPIGAGLGASAALCGALGRWFESMQLVDSNDVYEFARHLENLFHGESSGVDIAVALSGEGLRFVRHGERLPIQMNWQPHWYVSYTGKRGVTRECVHQVKALIENNPRLGSEIDQTMARAVEMAAESLQLGAEQGFSLLQDAMNLARSCFELWGLSADEHIQWLLSQGAVAAKPTGSGGGGFVLSLWSREPEESLRESLIPVFPPPSSL